MNATDLINALTPVVAILATELAKWLLPKLPKWSIPVVATFLGAVLNLLATYTAGTANSVVVAVALGLGATTIREVYKYVATGTTPATIVVPPEPPTKTQ